MPDECSDDDGIYIDNECQRGGETPLVWLFLGGQTLFFVVWPMIILCMVLIICKVRHTEARLHQYAGGQDRQYQRTREVAKQGVLYILAFFLTFFPIIIGGFSYRHGTVALHFSVALSVKMLRYVSPALSFKFLGWYSYLLLFRLLDGSPMQGFFNAVIFLRKRFRTLTNAGQPLSFLRKMNSSRQTRMSIITKTRMGRIRRQGDDTDEGHPTYTDHGDELHVEDVELPDEEEPSEGTEAREFADEHDDDALPSCI